MSRRKRKQTQHRETTPPSDPRLASPPSSLIALLADDRTRISTLAVASALLVATVLVPSELPAATGGGLLAVTLWLGVGATVAMHASANPKFRLRFSAIDAIVLAFLLWHSLAALWAIEYESARPATTMMWHVIGFGACYFAVRQLPRTPAETRGLVAVMLAVGVAVSVFAFYQFAYEMPLTRAMYEQNPDKVLADAGLFYEQGSPERMQFEARLKSVEPTGTFALTNSLAGYLAPWLVVLAGAAILGRTREASKGLRQGIGLLIGLLACGFCLILTQSRAGYVATLLGMVGVGWLWWQASARNEDARRRRRNLALWCVVGCVLVGAGVFTAAMFGGLQREIVSGASKSLGYRIEYWRSTSAMIADRSVLGCGPGNFRDAYTQYKLPEASEEIADPHNWLFELASTAGVPAALMFLAVLVALLLLVWRAHATSSTSDRDEPDETAGDAAIAALPIWRTPTLMGGVGGFVLAVLIGGLDTPWSGLIVGLPVFIVAIAMFNPWVAHGRLPLTAILIAIGACLVNLLIAGGITTPGVATTFWLLLALAVNSCTETSAGECHESAEGGFAPNTKTIAGLIAVVFLLLAAACHWTAYSPVNRSRMLLDQALRSPDNPLPLLQQAAAANPRSPEVATHLVTASFADWNVRRTPETWQAFLESRALLIAAAPRSAAAMSTLARLEKAAHDATGDDDILQLALADQQRAVGLYPNLARHNADLAELLLASGRHSEARLHANRALELDAITPHLDKKLADAVRARMRIIAIRPSPKRRHKAR